MTTDPRGEDALEAEFSDYFLIEALSKLQRERPELVQRFFSDRDGASLAAAIRELNVKKWDALRASAKPPKPAAKAASKSGKRPAFDENGDTTRRVQEILRSR